MNIIVCIKQVPATNEVKIDKETNTIIRKGVDSVTNPFDLHAVEEAVRLKEAYGGIVTALTMGLPAAEVSLREALSLGADNAVLLSGRDFAGSDTLATAYALSKCIRKIGSYDLVICGKQAVDGDTAQVGPSLAEKLSLPHITCVKKIDKIDEGFIFCQRVTELGYDLIKMQLPAVITVVREINHPRLPSIKGLLKARSAPVTVWKTAGEISADGSLCGSGGSPTRVVKTFTPSHQINTEFITGSPAEQAKKLAGRLFKTGTGKVL